VVKVFSCLTSQVQKIVREHYLRDDIPVEPDGGWADGHCVMIDTNVALHQVSPCYQQKIDDCLSEVQHDCDWHYSISRD
jgi:hypothetical protein